MVGPRVCFLLPVDCQIPRVGKCLYRGSLRASAPTEAPDVCRERGGSTALGRCTVELSAGACTSTHLVLALCFELYGPFGGATTFFSRGKGCGTVHIGPMTARTCKTAPWIRSLWRSLCCRVMSEYVAALASPRRRRMSGELTTRLVDRCGQASNAPPRSSQALLATISTTSATACRAATGGCSTPALQRKPVSSWHSLAAPVSQQMNRWLTWRSAP